MCPVRSVTYVSGRSLRSIAEEDHIGDPQQAKTYPVEEAIRAQKALRELAGSEPEVFPVEAFAGMISDEAETLRKQGHSDEMIARTIAANSKIIITPAEIAPNYASPEERHSADDWLLGDSSALASHPRTTLSSLKIKPSRSSGRNRSLASLKITQISNLNLSSRVAHGYHLD